MRVAVFLVLLGPAACRVPTAMDSAQITDERGLVTDLICPGATGCLTAEGSLSVGAAVRDITPVVETWTDTDGDGRRDGNEPFDDLNDNGEWDPVWMAGFDPGRASIGVHDANEVRALSLRKGVTRLGIAVLDLLGFAHDNVVAIRRAVAEAGLDFDHVTVVSTHQHQGKDAIGFAGPDIATTGYDPEYTEWIIAQTVAALTEALEQEEPVAMRLALGSAPELVGDSRLPRVIDQTIYGLNFEGAQGVVASVVIWGNHPEALGDTNKLISADYPGYLRRELEAHYPGAVGIFLPGTLGGLMNPMDPPGCPDLQGHETCPTGTYEKAEYIGRGAAQAIIHELDANPVAWAGEPTLAFRRQHTLLTISNYTLILGYLLGVFRRGAWTDIGEPILEGEALAMSWDEIAAGLAKVQSEVNAITLGPLAILTVPGEIYPELWLAAAPGTSFVERPAGADYPDAIIDPPLIEAIPAGAIRAIINQANDAVGYIIPRAQFDAVAPHAYTEEGQYGEGTSLGEGTAPDIDVAIRTLYELELR